MDVITIILLNEKRADGTFVRRFEGDSNSTQPTTAAVGDRFYELDTKTEYYWDGSAWTEVGSNA